MHIILASASPRRRELMKWLDLPFDCVVTGVAEEPLAGEDGAAMVERLSRAKAAAALAEFPESLVIAADTDVELEGQILGKPRDPVEARAMLTALRGRAHSVFTGLTLGSAGTLDTQVVHTRVWMRDFTDAERDAYIATGDPLDKAAGYAVQHRGFQPVARVDGCFANVMGLPLCCLYGALAGKLPLREPKLECFGHAGRDCSVPARVLTD